MIAISPVYSYLCPSRSHSHSPSITRMHCDLVGRIALTINLLYPFNSCYLLPGNIVVFNFTELAAYITVDSLSWAT